MEKILWLYSLPYNRKRPLICFDERPCFLIEDIIEPISMATGQTRKEHYAYKKNGSCALLAAIEPLTGHRIAEVYKQRTKLEFTLFCQKLASAYADADKIVLVMDNLNTHQAGSFYDHLPADEAQALTKRFEFHYTPKSASWLNMIEIEFSALTRLCFNRRIPTLEKLRSEVLSLIEDRSNKAIKINWMFTVDDCREKLNRKYSSVNELNSKFSES